MNSASAAIAACRLPIVVVSSNPAVRAMPLDSKCRVAVAMCPDKSASWSTKEFQHCP